MELFIFARFHAREGEADNVSAVIREVLVPSRAEPGCVAIQERPVPRPAAGDVLIEVSVVGVCGSDAHYFRHGRIGEHVMREPLVLGHEAAGRVVRFSAACSTAQTPPLGLAVPVLICLYRVQGGGHLHSIVLIVS